MKILFFSPFFYPKTGGLETVALYLAEGLQNIGHEVRLITHSDLKGESELQVEFDIIRNPNNITFFNSFKWCDVFIHHNVSLKGIWPLLLFPQKNWTVMHHITYYNHEKITFIESVKRQLSRLSNNISCSNYVNSTLPKKGAVLWNAYDQRFFYDRNLERKKHSLVFVGRLVSDKGCDLLIRALGKLNAQHRDKEITLDIIGDGPEKLALEGLVELLGLKHLINFKGVLKGEQLSKTLNTHEIIIIPSKWKEPFGIVALEGIACGCIPIYAEEGGLTEACGPLGESFKRNNISDLIAKIEVVVLNYAHYRNQLVKESENHLKQYSREEVVSQFDKLLAVHV